MVAVSATTRPQRPGEQEGREYYFLSDDEFQRRVDAGEFLEYVAYAGGRYGTLEAEVNRLLATGKGVILELEVEGAFAVRRRRPDATLVFVCPPSFEDLERRRKQQHSTRGSRFSRSRAGFLPLTACAAPHRVPTISRQ